MQCGQAFNKKKIGDVKMYIPEFWCGVIATILVLLGTIIIAAVVTNRKK